MQPLSLGEAARLTGKSKSTLTRAIKSGRLSARRRDDGSYAIDPAELSRAYHVQPPGTVAQPVALDTVLPPHVTPDTNLKGQLAAAEATLGEVRDALDRERETVDDLRRRLDQEREERVRLTALLAPPPRAEDDGRRGLWSRLFGRSNRGT